MVDAPPPLLRQPMFNAPWPALTVAGLIVATYALQLRLADQGLSLALFPAQVAAGHPAGLLTSLFLHVGWPHVLMNAGFALAFGAPVARLFGHGVRGVSAFFGFYTLCGLLAGLAFVALHPAGLDPVVGASGAVSGLMGSAARLLQTPDKAMLSGPDVPPTLGPLFSRAALSMATAWFVVNILFGVTGWAPGMDSGAIAWEAHLAGFLAGLMLVGPFARMSA